MAKYGRKAQESVEQAMHKYKRGKLESGKSKKTVKSPKQAIAIGLSEAREKGAKVPPAPRKKTTAKAKAAPKRKVSKPTAARKTKTTKKARTKPAARLTARAGARKKTASRSRK